MKAPLVRGASLVPIALACVYASAASPAGLAQATAKAPAASAGSRLELGPPRPIVRKGELGMREVPDMHTAFWLQRDGSYRAFISGVIGRDRGSMTVLETRDLLHYATVAGTPAHARAVFGPSCLGATYAPSCVHNWDSDYGGANYVFTAHDGRDLLMLYHGETRTFGSTTNRHAPFYAAVGVARSKDGGLSWSERAMVVTGAEQQWVENPGTKPNGIPEGGAIVAGDYVYAVYPYFRQAADPAQAPQPTLEMARAPLAGDGAPGTWTKLFEGSYGREPGIHGRGSPIVQTAGVCTTPRQPALAYSKWLAAHLLTFICSEGWFYSVSTDPDLAHWSAPVQFTFPAQKQFQTGQPNDDNYVLVTRGEPGGVIGQSGLVLYAHTDDFGAGQDDPHELWCRSFTLSKQTRP